MVRKERCPGIRDKQILFSPAPPGTHSPATLSTVSSHDSQIILGFPRPSSCLSLFPTGRRASAFLSPPPPSPALLSPRLWLDSASPSFGAPDSLAALGAAPGAAAGRPPGSRAAPSLVPRTDGSYLGFTSLTWRRSLTASGRMHEGHFPEPSVRQKMPLFHLNMYLVLIHLLLRWGLCNFAQICEGTLLVCWPQGQLER